jgi:hypothetical protein
LEKGLDRDVRELRERLLEMGKGGVGLGTAMSWVVESTA